MRKQKPERVYLSALSLNPFSCHYYYVPVGGWQSSTRHLANQVNLSKNEHEGVISYKAAKRMEKALAWLLYIAKPKRTYDSTAKKYVWFKINMITLTLPSTQVHSDQEITDVCLKNMLDVLRKQLGLVNYIWRAECQANGNIHYHLITDIFAPHKDVRKWWNQSVELLGYVSAFKKKWRHNNPNSTDVASVKHTDRIANYLCKYITKNRAFTCIGELREFKGEQFEVLYGTDTYRKETANKKKGKVIGHVLGGLARKVESKLWFLSRSLSKCNNFTISEDYYEFAECSAIINKVNSRAYQGKYVTSLYADFSDAIKSIENRGYFVAAADSQSVTQ